MAQDFFDEVKMHAKKQGLDHMGVSLLERHSVSFTTRFWQTWTWVILLGVRVFSALLSCLLSFAVLLSCWHFPQRPPRLLLCDLRSNEGWNKRLYILKASKTWF